jgi:serine/threonine protein kinase
MRFCLIAQSTHACIASFPPLPCPAGKYTLSGPRWELISDAAKDFIRRLLVYNPGKRMTAEQALKHPWLLRAKHEAESKPLDAEVRCSSQTRACAARLRSYAATRIAVQPCERVV